MTDRHVCAGGEIAYTEFHARAQRCIPLRGGKIAYTEVYWSAQRSCQLFSGPIRIEKKEEHKAELLI